MKIQFNTDSTIHGSEKLNAILETAITSALSRFSAQITRIEVHLSDENGNKTGQKDKRCLMEARVEGLQPIAVTHHADTLEHSVNGALDKMKAALTSAIGKLKAH